MSSGRSSGESNEQLGIGVGAVLNHTDPVGIVESASLIDKGPQNDLYTDTYPRPFKANSVDGFDFDIEQSGNFGKLEA